MMTMLHSLVVTGLLPSLDGLPAPLVSGLALIGCFALLLGFGYLALGPWWLRRQRHLHR
jgi:hypothetical protein